jgi:hypothetical protein
MTMFGVYGVLDLIFWLLAVGALILTVWALIHAVRTPSQNFAIAGKQTKRLWLAILGFATLFAFAGAVGYLGSISFFVVAAVIAAGIYLADVKPAVNEQKGGRGGNSGPYGPW